MTLVLCFSAESPQQLPSDSNVHTAYRRGKGKVRWEDRGSLAWEGVSKESAKVHWDLLGCSGMEWALCYCVGSQVLVAGAKSVSCVM